tara:strand:- start:5220 stop:5345 length:126 start_codon:yes stop_codon:yes gene_type:complete
MSRPKKITQRAKPGFSRSEKLARCVDLGGSSGQISQRQKES